MKIAVIAANGRLGRAFVQEALAAGHIIRAGARGEAVFEPHQNLTVVHCDATNIHDVKNLLQGQDAAVSAIGHVKGSAANVQTKATEILVSAMDELHMKRFVTVTGTGVRFSGDIVGSVDRFMNFAVRLVDPQRIKDGREHVKVLRQSDLEWTLIRVLKLQNIPTRSFKLTLHGPTKWFVGRSEVAKAIVQSLEQRHFIRQAPIITKNT